MMKTYYGGLLIAVSTLLILWPFRGVMKKIIILAAPHIIRYALNKRPDKVIGELENPYLIRWHLIPRNLFFNIYIHNFHRSDDDRALHDHPWANASIILDGEYFEETIQEGGIHLSRLFKAGDVKVRFSGKYAHRIQLKEGANNQVWTLFVTGPRYRLWGFHCPREGWIPFYRFSAENDSTKIGKGCQG